MANNNLKKGQEQAQKFMQANTAWQVELIAGKNPKQAVRMHVYFNNKLVKDVSTSAFNGQDFIDTLDNIKIDIMQNKTCGHSVATMKINHAWGRGNEDTQIRTYCKDEIYTLISDEIERQDAMFFSIDQAWASFNWLQFLQSVIDSYALNNKELINHCNYAKQVWGNDVLHNFKKIGKDLFITLHTYNKVMKVKKAYTNWLKNNNVTIQNIIPCKA